MARTQALQSAAPRNPNSMKAKKHLASAAANIAKAKKKHKFRAGTVALFEIRRIQKSTELLIPKAAFYRLIKEISQEYVGPNDGKQYRFKAVAAAALQESLEKFLYTRLGKSLLLAMHAGRVTIQPKDMQLAAIMETLTDLMPSVDIPTAESEEASPLPPPIVVSQPGVVPPKKKAKNIVEAAKVARDKAVAEAALAKDA